MKWEKAHPPGAAIDPLAEWRAGLSMNVQQRKRIKQLGRETNTDVGDLRGMKWMEANELIAYLEIVKKKEQG